MCIEVCVYIVLYLYFIIVLVVIIWDFKVVFFFNVLYNVKLVF